MDLWELDSSPTQPDPKRRRLHSPNKDERDDASGSGYGASAASASAFSAPGAGTGSAPSQAFEFDIGELTFGQKNQLLMCQIEKLSKEELVSLVKRTARKNEHALMDITRESTTMIAERASSFADTIIQIANSLTSRSKKQDIAAVLRKQVKQIQSAMSMPEEHTSAEIISGCIVLCDTLCSNLSSGSGWSKQDIDNTRVADTLWAAVLALPSDFQEIDFQGREYIKHMIRKLGEIEEKMRQIGLGAGAGAGSSAGEGDAPLFDKVYQALKGRKLLIQKQDSGDHHHYRQRKVPASSQMHREHQKLMPPGTSSSVPK